MSWIPDWGGIKDPQKCSVLHLGCMNLSVKELLKLPAVRFRGEGPMIATCLSQEVDLVHWPLKQRPQIYEC